MKKLKQSLFTKKFNNIDSHDNCDDILWSSSESSDCENKYTLNNSFSNSRRRKRKKKVNQNVSNLDIIEVQNNKVTKQTTNELYAESGNIELSPVLTCKTNKKYPESPILKSRLKSFKNEVNILTSPILSSKLQNCGKELSPVLKPTKSPQISPNVKKKLFIENNNNTIKKLNQHKITDSEVKAKIDTKLSKLDIENITNVDVSGTNDSNSKPKTKSDLMKRVQAFFDSNFSSQSLSQQSISECECENISKSSEELEIANIITQAKDIQTNQQNSFYSSCENIEKTKKKYKKDGLAYRLAGLIKKQNSNISLWQHEKFLATNSNFVIPTCEHWVFRIQNVQLKYGCYLIEAKDFKDGEYLIIINLISVNSNFIAPNFVIKLYKPYNLLEIDNFRVIVNVCKFECLSM